jgi:predicted TIM-barrel fold metal-dependent hydrolase
VAVQIVDVDVHPALRAPDELAQYTAEPWRTRDFLTRGSVRSTGSLFAPPQKGVRGDAIPPSGGPAGSDPEFTEQQLLQDAAVDYAILIPLVGRLNINSEHEAAMCAATNDWMADTWLSKYNKHGSYRGTIRVCANDADLAVREIERWADHPNFVQVMIPPGTHPPIGHPQFYPIYEAACRHGLPIALHPIQQPGMQLLTPVGYPSYYGEYHPQLALQAMSHLTSLIFEGVFEKFPTLRVALVEAGVSWILPMLWRLDNHWKALRSEVPWLKQSPSQYVREHVRLTTQPFEEPPDGADLTRIFELMNAGELLMFSTDYPHHDADDPKWVMARIPKQYRERVIRDNALDFYNLPRVRRKEAGFSSPS